MGQDIGYCSGCHAKVLWAVTNNGRSMPLNPQPDETGNVAMARNVEGIPCAWVLKKDEEPKPGERRYQSHFATCPKRPKPKTAAVTNARQAAAASRRGRRYPAAPLPEVLPDNVVTLIPRQPPPDTLPIPW